MLRLLRPTFYLSVGVIASLGLHSLSFAQARTPSTSLGTQELEKRVAEPDSTSPQSELKPAPQSEAVPSRMSKVLEDLSVDVSSYDVVGYDNYDKQALHILLEPFVGKGKNFEDMSNAAASVARFLQQEEGLYLAYAYIPAQDLKGGVVQIRVLPGVLDRIEVEWPEEPLQVDREVILNHLSALQPGTLIRVAQVERVIFLLNDLRGIDVSFGIQPGLDSGTATLVARPTNSSRVAAEVTLDDQGSKFAGELRASASIYLNSPLGLGDALSFTHLRSDTGGLEFSLLGYTLPIGSDGLKLGVNLSRVDYTFSDSDLPLGLEGDSTTLSVFGLYPVIRSRNLNLFATLGIDRRFYSDRLRLISSETRKDIQLTQLGLAGDARDSLFGGGINSAKLRLIRSSVDYPGGRPAGLDDAVHAQKWEWEFSRLQTLMPRKVMLWASARGQWARENLDPTEQCSLGGASNVRGYEQGTASGDICEIYTAEFRYLTRLPGFVSGSYPLSLAAFYDLGRVQYRFDPSFQLASFTRNDKLASSGLAMNWELGSDVLLQFVWAQAHGEVTDNPDPDQIRSLSGSLQVRF